MKKLIVVLILLIAAAAWASFDIGGGSSVGLGVGGDGVSTPPGDSVNHTGTYWGTARTDYWTDTRVALWSTARNTEIPE